MNSMNTPRNREEFERNFALLYRQMAEGRFQFPIDYPMDSMLRVRYLPNGRIDFLSVDEMARLNANTTGHFTEEFFEELKERQGHPDALPSVEDDDLTSIFSEESSA